MLSLQLLVTLLATAEDKSTTFSLADLTDEETNEKAAKEKNKLDKKGVNNGICCHQRVVLQTNP